jgi:hypothetical protein
MKKNNKKDSKDIGINCLAHSVDNITFKNALNYLTDYNYYNDYINALTNNYKSININNTSTINALRDGMQKYNMLSNFDQQLNSTVANLQKEQTDQLLKLSTATAESTEKQQVIESLKKTNDKLTKEISLKFLTSQVNEDAKIKLFSDNAFKELFTNTKECTSYVVSIDIRRSTELMLKARNPKLFEQFITQLCNGLSKIITTNFGVFDKFTGDGILAFYPDFYSGDDAGIFAFKSAIACHDFFNTFYRSNRHCFNSVLKNIGLGIGIDYGKTHLSRINTYTVIGQPVVYACRMSSAPANTTYINQPAYENLSERYNEYISFTETSINFKNEGETIAYNVESSGKGINIAPPDWNKLVKKHSKPIDTP